MSQEIVDGLKRKADKLQSEADKAQGALETSTARLKEDFDCKNLKEAKQLLKNLEEEEAEAQSKFNKTLEEFESKWSDKL